jgi:biopolymer transport protein ExbD
MNIRQKLRETENQDPKTIDMSPLIDVVFILLIFFIVSTVFVRETGVEVDKPSAQSAIELEQTSILIAITNDGNVVYDGINIGVSGVRITIESLLAKKPRPVVIQTDKLVTAQLLVAVIDEAKLAGSESVSIATAVQ